MIYYCNRKKYDQNECIMPPVRPYMQLWRRKGRSAMNRNEDTSLLAWRRLGAERLSHWRLANCENVSDGIPMQ